jgi:hypothetical protein
MARRAVCDAIRHSTKMDAEICAQAIQNYVRDPNKDVNRRMEYVFRLKIQRKVENPTGVWL